ncbi:MAG: hypothetical protein LBF64_00450, partial [Oscillospiraceae bacterium]|nr:hypothetical protein [Oscillospiraceae bacterium]
LFQPPLPVCRFLCDCPEASPMDIDNLPQNPDNSELDRVPHMGGGRPLLRSMLAEVMGRL